jgi:hypothetical protein
MRYGLSGSYLICLLIEERITKADEPVGCAPEEGKYKRFPCALPEIVVLQIML